MNTNNFFNFMINPRELNSIIDIITTYNTMIILNNIEFMKLSDPLKEEINNKHGHIDTFIVQNKNSRNKQKMLNFIVELFARYQDILLLLPKMITNTINTNNDCDEFMKVLNDVIEESRKIKKKYLKYKNKYLNKNN
jgi:hypothetical protein